jgi:hypothetical protein
METRVMTPANPFAPMLEAAVRAARVFRNRECLFMVVQSRGDPEVGMRKIAVSQVVC